MRIGLTASGKISRLLVLLFIFLCILSFLNRSPTGEPSKAVAFALEELDSESSFAVSTAIDHEKTLNSSQEENKPQKIWKKYVLDKVVLPLPLTIFSEASLIGYQLHGVDRHTLSFRFSGLAPPFIV